MRSEARQLVQPSLSREISPKGATSISSGRCPGAVVPRTVGAEDSGRLLHAPHQLDPLCRQSVEMIDEAVDLGIRGGDLAVQRGLLLDHIAILQETGKARRR